MRSSVTGDAGFTRPGRQMGNYATVSRDAATVVSSNDTEQVPKNLTLIRIKWVAWSDRISPPFRSRKGHHILH